MRFGFASAVAALVVASLPVFALAATVPAAIYTDPPHDAKFPASTAVLHIPTHGVAINGLAYLPAGPGAHPVLVICHGLPGNEKNLDLAQAVRRAGWVAVTFNYRGSWGSPGTFSFPGNLEDAAAVLTYLRDPLNAASLRLDPTRIVIAGHSMGGWVAAKTAARDAGLLGAVLISAWDPSRPITHKNAVAFMASDMESLAGVTAESMAAEREAHIQELSLIDTAKGLQGKRLLVLSADDGLAPGTDALVTAIRAGGGGRDVTSEHVATDHSWSDRRVALASSIIGWLLKLPAATP
jgi:pimeloyl-ACP methyl ester carboxylesterase